MNVESVLTRLVLTVFLALSSASAFGQGFAGLGSSADGFAIPRRGNALSFPADHSAHPDYRIEWWYVTANLMTVDGRSLGAQWTLFRSALSPGERAGWSSPQIWNGHAALTTETLHRVSERLARGGIGQASVTPEPFGAWIDDWAMKSPDATLDRLDINANGEGFSYQLKLAANGPLVLQGDAGYSVKSQAGQASFYYSQPFYRVTGTVVVDGVESEVSGSAWLDREWSSQPLAADQKGWDWFSLHLSSGDKLMAFRLRGSEGAFNSANWISADGSTSPLGSEDVSFEPLKVAEIDGKQVPVEWRIRVPRRDLDITVKALNDKSWMSTSTPYWEGPIRIEGTASGEGYLEMTGY